jgi:hypothetical protein
LAERFIGLSGQGNLNKAMCNHPGKLCLLLRDAAHGEKSMFVNSTNRNASKEPISGDATDVTEAETPVNPSLAFAESQIL